MGKKSQQDQPNQRQRRKSKSRDKSQDQHGPFLRVQSERLDHLAVLASLKKQKEPIKSLTIKGASNYSQRNNKEIIELTSSSGKSGVRHHRNSHCSKLVPSKRSSQKVVSEISSNLRYNMKM